MQKNLYFQNLFEKLPQPFAISIEQINSSYQSLYDKIYVSYTKNDFHRILNLLNDSQKISQILHFTPKFSEKNIDDSFLIKFVSLLYKIITIYPVKYYRTQIIAASFLNEFLSKNKRINGLKLDWYPFYKVMKFYTFSDESFFIRGCDFGQNNSTINKNNYLITNLVELSMKISKYFIDEYETEIDGQKIIKNTTEQLVKKFIPRISANGHFTTAYLIYFRALCPPHKGRYKLFIDYLIRELRDTSKYQCTESILALIYQSICCNIEDDFSFLLPVLSQLISTKIYQYKESDYPNRDLISSRFVKIYLHQTAIRLIPNIVIALFISPPTRKATLDLLESFFISFKSVYHTSVSSYNTNNLVHFLDHLVFSLRKSLRKVANKKEPKFFFNMKEELEPSKNEIHKLLSMISELRILNVSKCSDYEPILIETTLDPSTIEHYFEIAFQCINMVDAYGVAKSGWIILTALMNSVEKNELIRDNFETIFQTAVSNLYRPELQQTISNFLTIVFFKIPFNKDKTMNGFEYIYFPTLAYSYISSLISIYHSLPSVNGEDTKLDHNFFESILSSIITLLQNCDDDVMEELLPIFKSLASDDELSHSYYYIEVITANYCFFANQKQAAAVASAFKRQLGLPNNHLKFNYLSIVYSTALISNLKTFESVKQTVDFFIKYTKSDDDKKRITAWKSIAHSLTAFHRFVNVKVTLKPEKMDQNILGNDYLDDFNIKWFTNPDLEEYTLQLLDPFFDKLLMIKDSNEINNLLNEVGDQISFINQLIYQFNEGNVKDEVNEVIIDPIHNVPEVYNKPFPIKEKFAKCLVRILKDFNENEKIISHALNLCFCLFISYVNSQNSTASEKMRLFNNFLISFDISKKCFNGCFLFNALVSQFNKRRNLFIIPLTDEIKNLLIYVSELLNSKYQSVQQTASHLLYTVSQFYPQLMKSIVENMISNVDKFQINTIIKFINLEPNLNFVLNDDSLLCKIILLILNKFDLKDKEHLSNLKYFLLNACLFEFPFETPKENNKECINLLKSIEDNYLSKNKNNRTYHYILMIVILMCLKRVYETDDKIFEFILEGFIHFDKEISDIADICLSSVLRRRVKITKERIKVNEFPTVESFPNILDQVEIKFKEGGTYFPVTLKTFSSKELLFELNDEYSSEKISSENSNVDKTLVEINQDVKKVFESFNNIEIKWKIDERYKIFDTEFLFDQSNGYFMYKKSFNHKKYEFTNDKILIKNIPNILASAANSINEQNMYTCVRYHFIWKQIALIVGPNCIDQLNRLLINYLTQYYSMNAIVTSKILFDMISGFMESVCYWSIDDRIKFFKIVVLPAVCVILLNRNTVPFAESIITMGSIHSNPFCFAPLIKVLFELSPTNLNGPLFSRYLISIISNQPFIRPYQFFNSIDQFKDKFIVPFVNEMNDYSINEIDDLIEFLFALFDCCSLSDTKSPIYSHCIESKKEELVKLFEEILEKKGNSFKMKRILIRVLTLSFTCFNESSYDVRSLVSPIFVKHLHSIFNLLNSSNIKDESKFIDSVSSFIGNAIFINNTKLELEFVSLLIKEMMNSSLPMQLILLEHLNKMLESNIFNIPKEDYSKYEELLLSYGDYEKMKNLGNELRMKIAKILGIFEIRNNTLNCEITKEKVDQKLIDNEVLKAASIILNSYMFDRVDENVSKAFDLMDQCCPPKSTKSREFFKNVSKIFINRHSEHVINDAETMVIQYKNILTPSYLC